MKSEIPLHTYIRNLEHYDPPMDTGDFMRKYGLSRLIRLNANENALGPSGRVLTAVENTARDGNRYPSANGTALRSALAAHLHVSPLQIVLGNGSTGLIELIARTFLGPGTACITAQQTFPLYRLIAASTGATCILAPNRSLAIDPEAILRALHPDVRVIFLANPNNPTGLYIPRDAFERFMEQIPSNVLVVIDQAYREYVESPDYPDGMNYLNQRRNLIVLGTFSKIYSLAGFRIGYSVSCKEIGSLLNRVRPVFSTGAIAEAAAIAALEDQEHVDRSRQINREELRFASERLAKRNVRFIPSVTNFLLLLFDEPRSIIEGLLQQGILVSGIAGFHVPEGVRVTIGTRDENEKFLSALEKLIEFSS